MFKDSETSQYEFQSSGCSKNQERKSSDPAVTLSTERQKGCPHTTFQLGGNLGFCSDLNFDHFSDVGKFLLREELAKRTPDRLLILKMQKHFSTWCNRFERIRSGLNISCLNISENLHTYRWFTPSLKQRFIRLIGETLNILGKVECLTAEFGFWSQQDGLKLLLAISLGGGRKLKYFHAWRIFYPGQLPIDDPIEDCFLEDPFVPTDESDIPDDSLKQCMWDLYILKLSFITPDDSLLLLNTALQGLDNLVVLSIEYSALAGGQGNALCQLGCVRTGKLRRLNLLYTKYDHSSYTKRHISAEAWKWAGEKNPHFKVTLIAIRMADYDSISSILTPYMPLEKMFASSVILSKESLRLDLTARVLIRNYEAQIKSLILHVDFYEHGIVSSIRKLLLLLTSLENFEYRGVIDKVDSLRDVLFQTLQDSPSIRRLHFYLTPDEENTISFDEFYSELKINFHKQNVDFVITTI